MIDLDSTATTAHVEPAASGDGDTRVHGRVTRWIHGHRGPGAVLAAAIAITTYLTASTLAEHPPLYWDEAVYANRGRFFNGELDDGVGYWADYRAPGLPFMMSIGFRAFGVGTLGVRLPSAVFGLVLILLVFALGLLVFDAWAGAVASLLLSLSFGFTRFAAYGVPDVPGAALGLGATVAALALWRGGRLHPSAYVIVPTLAALATYVRFGAPLALGIGLLSVLVFVGSHQRRETFRRFAMETVVLGVATLIPVVAILRVSFFTAQRTSPLEAQRNFQANRSFPLFDSVPETISIVWPDGQRPDFFQPLVLAVVAMFALIGCVAAILEARYRPAVLFCTIGLVLTVIGLNLALDHMETRYLIVAAPYLTVLAGVGFAAAKSWLNPRGPALLAVGAVGLVLCIVAVSQSLDRQLDHARRLESSFAVIEEAGLQLAELDDPHCVVISGRAAQVGWYTGCRTASWRVNADQPIDEQIRLRTTRHNEPANIYVVDIVGHNRQPDAVLFDGPVFSTIIETGQPGARSGLHVRVHRVDDCVRAQRCS